MARKPMLFWNQTANALAIVHLPSDANGRGGYIRISRNNKIIYMHRWIWEQLIGPIPAGMQIDHINGIRTDNRLSNLRLVSQAEQMKNTSIKSHNTSGVTGVNLWMNKAWRAILKYGSKEKRATFSIAKYGNNEAFRLACVAREQMLLDANSQGAGFTPRHGK